MTNDWAIEVHDKAGRRVRFHRITTRKKIKKLVAAVMTDESTGGIVIYRSVPSKAQLRVRIKGGGAATADGPGEPGYVIIEPVIGERETEEVVSGNCEICGCPTEDMPMVNRGMGYCSENHRKQQLARSNNVE